MSDKMGESQVIDFFSGYIKDEFREEYGKEAIFSMGNFSGSQDRKFADFFVGSDSKNILIEFKEFKTEIVAENDKPLRRKLCERLNQEWALISRHCHFIGWGLNKKFLEAEFNPYIDLVCPLFDIHDYLMPEKTSGHESFVQDFIDGAVGADCSTFAQYIEHLNNVAGGSAQGLKVPFKSVLYSRNDKGKLIGTRFNNLEELNELKTIADRELRKRNTRKLSNRGGRGGRRLR
ncbi:hypothetical protein [Vibrio fluvialis]|uniref:hypothetical protein n=1 Tax=Vibrio fluvialis TaxID=676 RepID=UPI001EEC13AF|nr:hypothetical protein [Vibrio fluvialis]MCG6398848.1 hypothetical protein [Vibrio fluvialis]